MDDYCIRTPRTRESGINRPKRPAPPCMGEECGYCASPLPIRPPQTRAAVQMPSAGQMARPAGMIRQENKTPMSAYQPQTSEPAYNSLAMGYVPKQRWGQTYPPAQGLDRGTIFPELDRPFLTGRCQSL